MITPDATPIAIRYWRQARTTTQADLAGMLGVSRQTVHRWESGDTTPGIRRMTQIAHALEIPMMYLLQPPPEK